MQKTNGSDQLPAALAAIRRFAGTRPASDEVCDLCSRPIGNVHRHLFEPVERRVNCACDACAILFSSQANSKLRLVPRDIKLLEDFHLSDAQWDSLLIPIGMAFFFQSTPAGRTVVLYPSPAGPVESLLELETWQTIENANPEILRMEDDVEALLVSRINSEHDHFIAPIDKCYELVGLIRAKWRGLSGGADLWQAINTFLDGMRNEARLIRQAK